MSKKCKAYSESKLGLEPPDNRKAFYVGWDAALRAAAEQEQEQGEPVAQISVNRVIAAIEGCYLPLMGSGVKNE